MRQAAAFVGLAIASFLLAGCTGFGLAEFNREQIDSDRLELPARYSDTGIDPDSTRWLAEDDGVDFYAARSASGTCVIMVRDGDVDGSMGGCGDSGLGLSGVGFPSVRLYFGAGTSSGPKGWIELTPNLYVEK